MPLKDRSNRKLLRKFINIYYEVENSQTLFPESKESQDDYKKSYKTIRFSLFDKGLIEYLDEEYTEYILSDECKDYGDHLLNGMDIPVADEITLKEKI